MRYALVLATLAALAGSACEQRFSANPPPGFADTLGPAASSSSASIEALLAPADAGARHDATPHAMTITLCTANEAACGGADPDASPEGMYLVVFGGGRGGVRSRNQAMTDVYKELRDRLASGQHVDAEPRERGDGGAPHPVASSGGASDDPLTEAAFRLMDWVDATGAVTLDGVHFGSGCKVSIGSRTGERDASRCLIAEPNREPSKRSPSSTDSRSRR